MALVPEDGTGLASANCYISEVELDSYALLRNEDLSSYSTAQKEAAIYIAANDWMDALHEFKGDKVSDDQGMKLYTDEVTFADASKDIKAVNANTAILHLKGFLFVDPATQDANGEVKRQKDKLDVLECETEYTEGTKVYTTYSTPIADKLLRPYLKLGSGGIAMLRC